MFLYLEDIVPNGLIELIESNTANEISYKQAMEYGYQVALELEKRGINTTLVFYKNKTIQFERDYKNIFDFYELDRATIVKLKPNKNVNDLRDNFREYQTLDNIIAMTSQESRKVLGIKKAIIE